MDYVEGTSLAALVRENPLPAQQAARFVKIIAEAIHYAHQKGTLHRDLKPSNVLIDANDQPRVTDFGLAKRIEGGAELTGTGQVLGTPSYMPPEQAAARRGDIGPASDVYSLGALLYELLTGRPPFRAETPLDTLLQVLESEPVSPRLLNPKLPRDLETITLKCLQKEPRGRYASAQELADDLGRYLSGEPIKARPSTTTERVVRWARRNPMIAGLATALLVVLIGGSSSVVVLWLVAEQRRAQAEGSAHQAEASAQDAQDRLWQSLFEQARAERASGARWRSLELLGEAARTKIAPSLRAEAIQTIASPGRREVCTLGPRSLGIGGAGPYIVFSPDGGMIATPELLFEGDGLQSRSFDGIKVWQLPSGQLLGQAECDYNSGDFAFSPAAPVLALCHKGKVRLWDPKAGKELFNFPGSRPVRFSPDGTLLAAAGEKQIVLWNIERKQPVPVPLSGVPIAFLTSEELLIRKGERVHVWNIRSSQQTHSSPDGWSVIGGADGSAARDGSLVALRRGHSQAGQEAGDVAIWDARLGKSVAEIPNVGKWVYAASLPLSASSALVAFQSPSNPQGIRLFDLVGKKLRGFLAAPFQSSAWIEYGRFNPGGTILAVQERSGVSTFVRLWDVETGRSLANLHDQANPVWSMDGRYLAVFGAGRFRDGSSWLNHMAVIVYEVTPGPPTYQAASPIKALTFSSDGRRLAAQGNIWEVVESQQRRLHGTVVTPAAGADFFADGGRMWTVEKRWEIRPSEPVKLREVFPQNREIVLAGVERTEPGDIHNLAVSPDGHFLLLDWQRRIPSGSTPGSWRNEGQLELWDLALPKRVSILEQSKPGYSMSWRFLRFSPDGVHAVTQTRDLRIWDIRTAKALHEIEIRTKLGPGHERVDSVNNAVFSADGKLLFTSASGGRVDLIDVDQGKIITTWTVPEDGLPALALHPDGRIVACGGANRVIHLCDSATGRELVHWEGHDTSLTALAFSPDGRTLVSGSADGTLKLWDLPLIRRELAALGLDW